MKTKIKLFFLYLLSLIFPSGCAISTFVSHKEQMDTIKTYKDFGVKLKNRKAKIEGVYFTLENRTPLKWQILVQCSLYRFEGDVPIHVSNFYHEQMLERWEIKEVFLGSPLLKKALKGRIYWKYQWQCGIVSSEEIK